MNVMYMSFKMGLETMGIICLLLLITLSLIWSMKRWSAPISKTLEKDDEFDSLETIWSLRGIKLWFSQKRLSTKLRFRWFKSFVLIRIYSSNPMICKGILGIGLSSVAMSQAQRSPVLTGATVFYATMIFLKSNFEYAALWSQSLSISRLSRPEITDSVGISTTVINLGTQEAGKIEAKVRIIDGVRNLEGKTTPDQHQNQSSPTSISPSASGMYSFTFAGEIENFGNVLNRTTVNGVLGNTAFVVVEVRSPNQPVAMIQYKNISSIKVHDEEELGKIFSNLGNSLGSIGKYTKSSMKEEEERS